jgi:transposase
MPRSGPRKIYRYSDEFKLTAVRLSQQPGIQVQTVAAALEIHPFMLSKWRKEARRSPAWPFPESAATGAGTRDRSPAAARAEVRRVAGGTCTLKKSHPVLERSTRERFAFIDHLVTQHQGFRLAPL